MTETAQARRGVLAALASAVLFGTTGTAASFVPASAGPVAIGAARVVIGGFGLLLALPFLGGRRAQAIRLWRTRLGLAAGLATALYQLAFFAGVSLVGVALGTLVTIGSAPIIVGLLSWVALGERPTIGWWTSTAICLTGLALLTFDGSGQEGVVIGGLVFALVSAVAYAAYTVASKQIMRGGVGSTEAMASAFGLGAVVLVPVLIFSGAAWLATPEGLVVALWLGLITTAIAYVLFGRGLRELPAGPVTTLVLAEPLVATLLGVGLLGETLGTLGVVGLMLVASGLALQGVISATDGGRDRPPWGVEPR
ncbi:MAG: EamA family transporter [Candidatus Limnocylindrales bacterium]